MAEQNIIFFDGICHLCNGFVDFVIEKDKKRVFKFAPLQGEVAKKSLSEQDQKSLQTIVLIFNGVTYRRSKAVLVILSQLGFPFNLLSVFRILPEWFSNFFYNIIAKNRYNWFGEREFCRIPKPEEREYLLD